MRPTRFRRGQAAGLRRLVARALRSSRGVSAVEFAILAPLLVLGSLATADIGRAVYERMMIAQALRAGAQLAMAGAGESDVRAALETVAGENFTIAAGDGGGGALQLGVSAYCGCPGQAIVQLACTAVCDSGQEPGRFYRLSAGKSFRGVMLPAFGIAGTLEVMAE